MAYDSQLYLRDAAASGSLFTAGVQSAFQTKFLLLPGVPLRGLELNIVTPTAASTPTLAVVLLEAISTGATPRNLRTLPSITAAGDYHFRFHPTPGYFAVSASLTVSGSTGAGFGNTDVRIGLNLGAFGNPQPS